MTNDPKALLIVIRDSFVQNILCNASAVLSKNCAVSGYTEGCIALFPLRK
jgi:hypothetical protein